MKYRAVVIPLLAYLVLRLLTATTALVMTAGVSIQPPEWIYYNSTGATYAQTLPENAPLYSLTLPWHRYDTLWYTKNALQGYKPDDPGIVFFPLYAFLIRLTVTFCAGNYVLAALIISNLSCIAMLLLLYQLVVFEKHNQALASRVVLCVVAFPTAFYLVAGYTESLFLALTIGSFLLALHRRWMWAGILALLVGLTRLQGVLLCLPLGWIAYVHYRPTRLSDFLRRLPTVMGSLVGTGAYLLYLAVQHYSLSAVYVSEWKSSTNFPWASITTYLTRLLNGQTLAYENDNALVLLVFSVLALYGLWQLRHAYNLYVGATLIAFLMRYYEVVQLESMFRYVLQLFPCFITLGLLLRRRWILLVYLSFSLSWQIVLLSRFIRWIWVA